MEMLVDNNPMPDTRGAYVDTPQGQSLNASTGSGLGDRASYQREMEFPQRLALARETITNSGLSGEHKRELLRLIRSEDGRTFTDDQVKLIDAIAKLIRRVESEQLAQAAASIPRDQIIESVLESVAGGSVELAQGNVASCTATATGKIYMRHNGIAAYTELMSDLIIDGFHNIDGDPNRQIKLNESFNRNEGDNGLFEGASVAECIFRSSVMELSCRGLELADPRITARYDDATGTTYLFDKETGESLGSFAGMHKQGWLHSMEILTGSGVEFMSSRVDKDGKFSPEEILRQLMGSRGGAGIELSYAQDGPHNRHFCEFLRVEPDEKGELRVYFNNPHVLNDKNFKRISSSHRLEADGSESLSIEDFKQRLLSASIVRDGSPIGAFTESNNAQQTWRNMDNITNWYLENRHAHMHVQSSIIELLRHEEWSKKEKNENGSNLEMNGLEMFYKFEREEDAPAHKLNERHEAEEKCGKSLLREMRAQARIRHLNAKFSSFNPLSLRSNDLLNYKSETPLN